MSSFPLPDPNPTPPAFEVGMFAILFIGAMVFMFWWIVTMLPEQVIGFKKWNRDRKEKKDAN